MGTAHNQEDPGCRAVAVAALCQGHPDLPGSHQKSHRWSFSFLHHAEEPGQEMCKGKVEAGLGWGSSRVSSSAVLEPKAPEGGTSSSSLSSHGKTPLSSPQPTPAVFCAGQASRFSGAAPIRLRCPPAAHTTAVNAFPPGNYSGTHATPECTGRVRHHPWAPCSRNLEMCSRQVSTMRQYFSAQLTAP